MLDRFYNIIYRFYNIIHKNFPFKRYTKKFYWKFVYQNIVGYCVQKDWRLLNYGYAEIDPKERLELDESDEAERYQIQLYQHVVRAVDLKDLEVLEVSCGRGGGSYYIKRYLKPRRMVGVDFCKRNIEFCKKEYSMDGLSFKMGDAESLPFEDNSFDVILNIEASHCYSSMEAFLNEVKRVLRHRGYFLFTDFRPEFRIELLRKQLYDSGMILIKETDIAPNVLESMKLDNRRKTEHLSTLNKLWVSSSKQFIGAEDSGIHKGLDSGWMKYSSFVIQRP